MAGCTQGSIFIFCFQKLIFNGTMKLVAAGTVGRGKGLMQAESPSFIRLFFVAGEAESALGCG